MGTERQLAEMLCGGSPERSEATAINGIYNQVAVMLLLDRYVKQSDDPAATAKDLLAALHAAASKKIAEEIAEVRSLRETSIGMIFGGMIPKPEEMAAGLQDRLGEVHSVYAKFLLRDFETNDPT